MFGRRTLTLGRRLALLGAAALIGAAFIGGTVATAVPGALIVALFLFEQEHHDHRLIQSAALLFALLAAYFAFAGRSPVEESGRLAYYLSAFGAGLAILGSLMTFGEVN
jgi:phosphate/sulfate permease